MYAALVVRGWFSVALLLVVLFGLAGCAGAEGDRWSDLVLRHVSTHPAAEAADVYKFIHQSVFGPAHLITDRESAHQYLVQEVACLEPLERDEPLIERLSHDPPVVRVNLRPFVAAGGDLDELFDALVVSANQVRGDPGVMAERLSAAAAVLRELERPDVAADLDRLAEEQAAVGYPALHHSKAFTCAYRPAYRVVLLPRIEATVATLQEGSAD